MTTTQNSSSATLRKSVRACTVQALKPSLWRTRRCLSIGTAHLSAASPARAACSIGGRMLAHLRPRRLSARPRTSPHGRESICLLWRLPRSSKPVDWRATIESLPTSTAQCWREHIANTASNSLHGIGTMTARVWYTGTTSWRTIVGPSGSGKTTLCNLMARFWDVQGGIVCLGGWDVRE